MTELESEIYAHFGSLVIDSDVECKQFILSIAEFLILKVGAICVGRKVVNKNRIAPKQFGILSHLGNCYVVILEMLSTLPNTPMQVTRNFSFLLVSSIRSIFT